MSERSPLPRTVRELPPGPVLLVAPHPDDEVLGCGLTCHRHHLRGDSVHVVIAYDGALGNKGSESVARAEFVRRREEEARASCRLLGFDTVEFLGYPEGHEPGPAEFSGAARRIAELVELYRPATLYAPWTGEHQIDHSVLARAVERALDERAACGAAVPKLWSYEVWSALVPTDVVDVTEFWDLKRRALAEHRSQFEHTDLLHHIGGLNAHRALYVEGGAARFAEAFARRD